MFPIGVRCRFRSYSDLSCLCCTVVCVCLSCLIIRRVMCVCYRYVFVCVFPVCSYCDPYVEHVSCVCVMCCLLVFVCVFLFFVLFIVCLLCFVLLLCVVFCFSYSLCIICPQASCSSSYVSVVVPVSFVCSMCCVYRCCHYEFMYCCYY